MEICSADPHACAPPACLITSTLLWQWRVFPPLKSNRQHRSNAFFFKLDHLCFSKHVLVRANVGGSGGCLQQTSDDSHWKFLQFAASIIPSDIWWFYAGARTVISELSPRGTGPALNENHPDVLVPRFSSILEHPNHKTLPTFSYEWWWNQ